MMKANLFELNNSDVYVSSLKRVDAQDILDHYGADNITQMGEELIHSCLIDRVHSHHTNGDANPSASMNIRTKQYNCFSYGGGSLFWLLELMEGSLDSALEKFDGVVRNVVEDHAGFMKKLRAIFEDEEHVKVIPQYSDRLLRAWEGMIHPYLTESRGLDPGVLEEYRVGWSEEENRIIMPHFFKGNLVGWQRRTIPAGPYWPATADGLDKYLNSPSFPKAETLFNYDKAIKSSDEVISTEGAFRVYVAEAFEGRPLNVVSSFNSKVSKIQADLLSSFKRVYIWNDADYSGYSGAYWALHRLYKRTNAYYIEGSDLADLSQEEALEAKENAIPAALAFNLLKEKLGKGFKCPL